MKYLIVIISLLMILSLASAVRVYSGRAYALEKSENVSPIVYTNSNNTVNNIHEPTLLRKNISIEKAKEIVRRNFISRRNRLLKRIRRNFIAKNKTELIEALKYKKELINKTMINLSKKIEKRKLMRLKNQNRVRLAVFSFLAMKNITGIGRNVSTVAKNINHTYENLTKMENKIEKRNPVFRFIFGGEKKIARNMEKQLKRINKSIEKLYMIKEKINDTEIKSVISEQIKGIETEKERLMKIAKNEEKNKGIFGWLFRWL